MKKSIYSVFLLLALSLNPVLAEKSLVFELEEPTSSQLTRVGPEPLEERLKPIFKTLNGQARQKRKPVIFSSLSQAQRWNLKIRPATGQGASIKL